MDIDRDRFFRAIDRAILEHHSRPSGLPLMLATLDGESRAVPRRQPQPVPDGRRDQDEPRRPEPRTVAGGGVADRRTRLPATPGQAGDDFQAGARPATSGRTTWLRWRRPRRRARRHIAGRGTTGRSPAGSTRATGQDSNRANLSDPEVDDVLDDLAELVLRMKGDGRRRSRGADAVGHGRGGNLPILKHRVPSF